VFLVFCACEYGGFIIPTVHPFCCSRCGFCLKKSSGCRLLLPSPRKIILVVAIANILSCISMPYSCSFLICLRCALLSVRFIMRCMAAIRNPPVPQHGSSTLSSAFRSIRSQKRSVICFGVRTMPSVCPSSPE